MKTREQRRQRWPLGSVFVGQAPQKRSLAGAASCLLHNMVALLVKPDRVVRSRGRSGMGSNIAWHRRHNDSVD